VRFKLTSEIEILLPWCETRYGMDDRVMTAKESRRAD